MASVRKIFFGLLTILIASSVITIISFNSELKTDIGKTNSKFYFNDSGNWTLAAIETSYLMNGGLRLAVANVSLSQFLDRDSGIAFVNRTVYYAGGASLLSAYEYDKSLKDVELFPVREYLVAKNSAGLVLVYKVSKLKKGKAISGLKSPYVAGKIKIEWQEPTKVAKVTSGGTLTLNYDVISQEQKFNIRLFDPYVSGVNLNESFIISFANNTNDSSANTLFNFTNNGVTFGQDSIKGVTITKGIFTRGDNDYLNLTTSSLPCSAASGCTIVGWFKRTNILTNVYDNIFEEGNQFSTGWGVTFTIGTSYNSTVLQYGGGSLQSDSNFTNGTWIFAAFVINDSSSGKEIWSPGPKLNASTSVTTTPPAQTDIRFGSSSNGGVGSSTDTGIDMYCMRFYNASLPQSYVSVLYNNGIPECKPLVDSLPKNVSMVLMMDNKTTDSFYEYQTTASLLANFSGQTGNETICYKVVMSTYGADYFCGNTSTPFLFNITQLIENTFGNSTSNGTTMNFTANGEANVSLDNRTIIKLITFNVSGVLSGGAYPENVSFGKVSGRPEVILPGQLIGNMLYEPVFFDTDSYKPISNLSFSSAGSKVISVNISLNDLNLIRTQLSNGNLSINLTFNVTGFNVDDGNNLNLVENFNHTGSLSWINISGVNVNSTAPNASWENFEKNLSGMGRWNSSNSGCAGGVTPLIEYQNDTTIYGGNTVIDCSGTGSAINYWIQEFDIRNITRINLSVSVAVSCSSSMDPSNAQGKVEIGFYDFSNVNTFYDDSVSCISGSSNSHGLTFINFSLVKRPTENTWDIIEQTGSSQSTSSFTPTMTGNNWFLSFKSSNTGAGNPSNGRGTIRIMDVMVGGISASRYGVNEVNITTFSSVLTRRIITLNPIGAVTLYATDLTRPYWNASINVTYELSNNNGTNFVRATLGQRTTFATSGNGLVARINCTSSTNNQSCLISSLNFVITPAAISNVSVDFGSDNVNDFYFSGELNSSNSPVTVYNSSLPIVSYALTNCASALTCRVPIRLTAATGGIIQVSNFNSTLPVRNVTFTNMTPFLNRNPINWSVYTSLGNLILNDLRVYYVGSRNITITASYAGNSTYNPANISRTAYVRYSIFNLTLPRLIKWTEFLFTNISGSLVSQTNVTPYGQNRTVGIHTIAPSNYENLANFTVRLNETPPACLAFRIANNSASNNSKPLNMTWVENLYPNVAPGSRNQSLWLWSDANSCNVDTMAAYSFKFQYARICSNCTRTVDLFNGANIISTD